MAPGCNVGRRQAGGGSVILWAKCCLETLGPAIHVDVTFTRITYLSIVADYVHTFIETLFPDGCGLFQQDNALSQSNQASLGCAGQMTLIHGGPTSQLTGLEGSAANILVPDTTAHLQGTSGVYALTCQGCFGRKRGTNTMMDGWMDGEMGDKW
ncbi:hypothetical protein QTP86_031433 [Hemibagrus guttatus]|nr:hypothetical protein QTP86_031433 [Hemibagrus guttatus]